MNIYIVHAYLSFGPEDRVDSYHFAMFHGVCERKYKSDTNLSSIEYQAKGPLMIITNAYRVNPIIQPGLNLVVTAEVGKLFSNYTDVKLVEVIIEGVAMIEYAEGSMKHWDNPRYKDSGGTPERILVNKAKRQNLKWTGPQLLEVVPHDGEIIYDASPQNSINIPVQTPATSEVLEIRGSRDAFKQYGYLWSDGMHCFRDDIFKHFKDAFHKDYYFTRQISI